MNEIALVLKRLRAVKRAREYFLAMDAVECILDEAAQRLSEEISASAAAPGGGDSQRASDD